jgi:predicted PurR-regulated permease PerM
MKFYDKDDNNNNYFKIFLAVFLALVSSIIVYFLFSKIKYLGMFIGKLINILSPVLIGILFAYLLNPFVKKVENLVNKSEKIRSKNKLGRILGIIIVYLIVLILIFLFINFFIPSLLDSINLMINNFPTYLEKASTFLRKVCEKYNINPKFIDEYTTDINALIKKNVVPNIDVIINNLASGISTVIKGLINIIISIIISIYLIFDKEMFISGTNKVLKAICPEKIYNDILIVSKNVYNLFGGFLVAKGLDSLIIGVITFIILTIFKFPYTLLIAVMVGVTNIIPFFGPFIGAIPSAFLLLMISPPKALEFIIIILIIQQFDGNILSPKMIGDKIGIKSFWVLFAIILFGGLFGFLGMIIAVPLFACIYEFIKHKIEKRLEEKDLAN